MLVSCKSFIQFRPPVESRALRTLPILRPESCPISRKFNTGRSLLVRSSQDDTVTPLSQRDDDVLPDNLADALWQASAATSLALEQGIQRCIVELLLPEFWDPISGPVFKEDGDQLRFWKLSRRFIENLQERNPSTNIKALFPDMGVTAMLRSLWTEATFEISPLRSKTPLSDDAEVIVLAAPDPLSLEDCRRIVREMPELGSIIMFNPRLASGDVGIGLNVRRLQNRFLSTFTTTYSLRPIGDVGSVFKRYPGQWQVFLEDKSTPGRYELATERPDRPAGDVLEAIMSGVESKDEDQTSPSSWTASLKSFQSFLNSLSK
eukprot:g3943.t1